MTKRASDHTLKKEEAALLVAQDALSDAEIAKKVGIARRTLAYWKNDAGFGDRVSELTTRIAGKLAMVSIAERVRRVAALDDRWRRLRRIIDARAADPAMRKVPGGSEGLMVCRPRVLGTGPKAKTVLEYEIDTGLLAELRGLEKQAAIEVGDWSEKQEISGDPAKPLRVTIIEIMKPEGVDGDDVGGATTKTG
jgi:transposase-like protein